MKLLNEIISFAFYYEKMTPAQFPGSSVYWTSKGAKERPFKQKSLKNTVPFLISKCVFTVGNLMFKQNIGIPMGTESTSFRAN